MNQETAEPDDLQTGSIKLKDGINLESVLTGQTFTINFDDLPKEEDMKYDPKDVDYSAGLLAECFGDDNDEDINATPFDKLATKMVNIISNGGIKKRTLREGRGDTPPEKSTVFVLYTSYLEYCDEPIDCAYSKKPLEFQLGRSMISGLNIAIQSMRCGEKAQFLISPDYAFGKIGHPPRIPPGATFLFQVELIRYVDAKAGFEMDKLTLDNRKQFSVAYKTALSLIEIAKEHFKHNLSKCIHKYNRAVSLLEECSLSDMAEQEKQQMLLFRLYCNLAICYNKDNNPRRACIMCNNIYAISKNIPLVIPAKLYYNNGRALYMLSEYKRAKEKFLQAQRLEPNNKQISNEIVNCVAKIKEEEMREQKLAKNMLNFGSDGKEEEEEEKPASNDGTVDNNKQNDVFAREIGLLCDELLTDEKETRIKLPFGLTARECDVAKTEAEKRGLKFWESKHNENEGTPAVFISKN